MDIYLSEEIFCIRTHQHQPWKSIQKKHLKLVTAQAPCPGEKLNWVDQSLISIYYINHEDTNQYIFIVIICNLYYEKKNKQNRTIYLRKIC